MNREKVIDYLVKLTYTDRQVVYEMVNWEINEKEKIKRYHARQAKNIQYQKDLERGREMKKIVKVGDVVKCKGTKDGTGIREVMNITETGIIARKIAKEYHGSFGDPGAYRNGFTYIRDDYITTHGWEKVVEILDIKIEE